MGKNKNDGNYTQSKDIFARMNYLYQASQTVLAQSSKNSLLTCKYIGTMRKIAKKSCLKIEPNIKRTVCKKCCCLLVPGVTARVRHRKKTLTWTCLTCNTVKKFYSRRGHQLWCEKPESTVSVVTMDGKSQSGVAVDERDGQQSELNSSISSSVVENSNKLNKT